MLLTSIALRGGRLNDAQKYFLGSIERAPGDSATWGMLGLLQKARGCIQEALSAHCKALILEPASPEKLTNFSNFASAIKRDDLAERRLRWAAAINPEHLEPQFLLVKALGRMKRFAETAAVARQLLKSSPGDRTATALLAAAEDELYNLRGPGPDAYDKAMSAIKDEMDEITPDLYRAIIACSNIFSAIDDWTVSEILSLFPKDGRETCRAALCKLVDLQVIEKL